jgi:hypothetical protein
MGRPQTGCKTFGCFDFMRVPFPAAKTIEAIFMMFGSLASQYFFSPPNNFAHLNQKSLL